MKLNALFGLFLAAVAMCGCSTPALDIEEPRGDSMETAVKVLDTTRIPPERGVHSAFLASTVDRVAEPIRRSSFQVCMDISRPLERCAQVLRAQVVVLEHEEDPNAFADQYDNVYVHGGLVSTSGSDQEVAAVLAHEFAHIMFGHVESKMENALAGMALAGGLLIALGDEATYNEQTIESVLQTGYVIGSRAYGPEMEIEADRAAIYILKHAGYSTTAMRDSLVRMHRNSARRSGLFPQKVGFLQTHPSNDRRIAHIMSAIVDVERGVPLVAGEN